MTSIRVYGVWCLLFAAFALALPLQGTTIVMPTDEQLIEKTPVIVRGTVVRSEPVEIEGGIWTETVLSVQETLKGKTPHEVTIREVGGRLGNRETVVFGSPEYEVGGAVLAFLWPTPRGDYQTMDLLVGKFSEEWTIDGQRLWYRTLEAPSTQLLNGNFEPIENRNVQRDAARFGEFVRDRIAGRKGDPNYGVSNPRLVRSLQSNFELISEPTVYRWFAFESGASVPWKGVGSQPGYSNGGVSDTQTAMDVWSGYGDANIRYGWGGSSSSAPGGLDKSNGINEVIFNDPLGEIAGTWTGQGGVVGRGGFNRISGSRSWTSPFGADGSHPSRSYVAYDITEGNLVLQDGVSPTTGISSSRFAEIIAHEFGHTLGFGHSADGSALMYATVTGLGPSLRSDDQIAARWLYPSSTGGGGGLEIPAAPSNLTAQSLSSTTVRLRWNDNSSIETSQTVYVNAGSGYTKLDTLGANTESVDVGGLTSGKSYSFRITASNSAGESDASNAVSITTSADPVNASFSVSPASGTAGVTTFTFSDQSSGPITSWQWSFGDGKSSTTRNVSHVYSAAGTYSITLTVRGSSGQQSSTARSVQVNNPAPAVVAAFDLSATSVKENETIAFYDRSSGSPTWWQWSFGDGATSSARNPSHAYSRSGTYQVVLKSGNASGSSTASRSVSVGSAAVSFRSLVPVSTAVSGVGGTNWRTDLTIYNASSFGVHVNVVYLPTVGQSSQTRTVWLASGRAASWPNVLADLFGISTGAGALHFETASTNGSPDLRVSSRTYTDSQHGTYGQFVGDQRGSSVPRRLHLAGLASNEEFRSNVGLVNRGGSPVSTTLSLYGRNGALLGRKTMTIARSSFQQQPLTALFPALENLPQDEMSMEVVSSEPNAVTAYASIVDNTSQDPVFAAAAPAETDREIYVAAAGRTGGASGTFWRSDVTLFNPGSSSISATIRFLRAGQDNRFGGGRSISLGPNGTRTIRDVVSWLGAGEGSGAILITWSGQSEGIVATSRTYTTRGFDSGSLGQSIAMTGSRDFGRQGIVTGLRSDNRFRTNVGLVNSGESTIGVNLRLVAQDGRQLATAFVTLAPQSQIQTPAAGLFKGVSFANLGSFTVVADSPASTMFAYGSVIDNQSGDPIFVSGR